MKTYLTLFALAATLIVTAPVDARGYGHGYRHGGHFFGHGYHGGGYGYGFRGHGGHHAGYLVGGLLLGAMLAPPRYVVAPPVVYAPQAAPVAVVPPAPARVASGRRLLRDINGNCFERQTDASGREVRLSLPPGECAW